ncbi:MAG: class I SAM-dependent DNA methyltransferase, partial [Defluviicoccus sp.]|nr:class I SAM-dependent DNA methyltransferase [Defluviicoccus sp.]
MKIDRNRAPCLSLAPGGCMLIRTGWKQDASPDEPLGTARSIVSLASPTAFGIDAVTPGEFIAKWRASELKERSASQSHFIDLCRLLGESTPTDSDPAGEWYCFERGARKDGGGDGWADVWKRGCFAWEYKGRRADLDAAFDQLRQYALALENPPLLIVSDMARFRIRTNWTNSVSVTHEFTLDDLADGATRDKLKWAMSDPERLRPGETRQTVTERVAATFAELAQGLRDRGHDPQTVAHFANRLVFCMFAEDVGLLPGNMFTRMLEQARRRPDEFAELARDLFGAMSVGGRVGFESVAWFNGGLFDDDAALPLDREGIETALKASALDWSEIDPSILGTLFERGLDPDKRSQLGAHYTDRDKIMRIVDPVIVRPLLAEWETAKTGIAATVERADAAGSPAAQTRLRRQADRALRAFLGEIQWMRRNGFSNSTNPILDPLDTIECRDAILTPADDEPDWPVTDAVIGNPPFLGGKLLIGGLGEDYVSRMFAAWKGRVPREADLVCYWFVKAGEQVAAGRTRRVGLVATNSVRGGANRRALQAATDGRPIFDAWSDEPWVIDGAAVRVSLVCFSGAEDAFKPETRLDGELADEIHSDLTARRGRSGIDLTGAKRIQANIGTAFMGDTKGGPFDVPGDLAREWLRLPANPNGRPNADVLKPWVNGMDLTRRPADKWIVDFGWSMTEADAALYEAPFAQVKEHVWPMRQRNRREAYRLNWWRHVEPRQGMWRAIGGLTRYIATPRVAKHRLFVWL